MIQLSIKRLFRISCTAVICLLGGVQVGVGAEVDFELRLGGTYSDNASRAALLETSDTIATAGVWLDVAEQTKRFDGSLVANVDHNVYTDDTFDDETIASVAGEVDVQLVPGVISWFVADNFGKLRTNPFQADTPTNREDINRFSTGPELTLRIGAVTAIEVGGQYKNTQFETSNFDNDVLSGNISLIRALSETRSISLNITADRIEYDSGINSNFDLQSAYLGFESRISRGELAASVGVNRIHDNGTTSEGLVTNLAWARNISSSSTVSLEYDKRFSDAGDLFERIQDIETDRDNSLSILGNSGPLEVSRSTIGYKFDKNGNTLTVSFSHNDYDYEADDLLDRDLLGIRFGLRRQLGAAWHAGIQARAESTKFDQSGREDDDLQLSITFGRRLSRTLGLDFAAKYSERSSDTVGFSYEENRYTVQLVYAPGVP